jgi:DnaJ family protein A protein 2
MDPYDILGVNRNSTEEEIKKSYKNLARRHHPDKGGDEEKFKEITSAYSQIMEGPDQMIDGMPPDISEMLKMFGGISGVAGMFGLGRQHMKGPTVSVGIKLSLEQLEKGGVHKIKYSRNIPTGKMKTCFLNSPIGPVNIVTPEEITKEYEIEIKIPSCHDQRVPLIFNNYAKADEVPSGDLHVIITLEKHEIFKRVPGTLDLCIEFVISLKESLTGFKRSIKRLNDSNEIDLECESVVNPYDTKTILTYGMNDTLGKSGDLIIKFIIVFPVILDSNVKQLILDLDI